MRPHRHRPPRVVDGKIDLEISMFEGKRLVSVKGTTPLAKAQQQNRDRLLGISILEAAADMVDAGEADGFGMDDELRHLIYSREAYTLYERWFNAPIPPKNIRMNIPMNYLLKEFWRFPTDQIPG